MELLEKDFHGLKEVWADDEKRQSAKAIITNAIGRTTELSVKLTEDVLDELDRMLKEEEEDSRRKGDSAL
jgi:hypothetical protein